MIRPQSTPPEWKISADPLKIKSLKAIGKNQAFYRASFVFLPDSVIF